MNNSFLGLSYPDNANGILSFAAATVKCGIGGESFQ